MPRISPPTPTTLGAAIRAKRGAVSLESLAPDLKLSHPTLSRIERGTHQPSYSTAKALAAWLGWSLERVLEAAETPAEKEKIEES